MPCRFLIPVALAACLLPAMAQPAAPRTAPPPGGPGLARQYQKTFVNAAGAGMRWDFDAREWKSLGERSTISRNANHHQCREREMASTATSPPREQRCETCAAWDGKTGKRGACRRRSPMFTYGMRPWFTVKANDWCLDWVKKDR